MDVSQIRPASWQLAAIFVVALSLTACTTAASTDDLLGVVNETPQPKPSFQLTDTNGDVYDFAAETEGKLTLLYFGYLNCPDICPVHLAQIAETFDQIPDVARDTEVVFVTVDPERDSPDDIRAFLDNFDSRFVGLTGTLEEVQAAQNAANVAVAIFVGDGEDYTVNHAAQVIAYAPDGLSYSVYPFGVRQSQWNNDLALLAGFTS